VLATLDAWAVVVCILAAVALSALSELCGGVHTCSCCIVSTVGTVCMRIAAPGCVLRYSSASAHSCGSPPAEASPCWMQAAINAS
jgi:hypothetical protein